jgi:hypothetical protein
MLLRVDASSHGSFGRSDDYCIDMDADMGDQVG